MKRRSRAKSSFFDELYAALVVAPVWAGPILALIAFAAFRWVIPWAFAPADPKDLMAKTVYGTLAGVAAKFAPWGAGAVLFVWLFALFGKQSNRRRLDGQTGIESIRRLSWQDFERLLAEAFRRQGFAVEQVGGARPDGGVDLRLRRQSEVVLVQCKQWLTWNVGVKVVREMYGVVAAEHATRGIVVTSGKFSADAQGFARTVPITLIDGNELLRLVADVQARPMTIEPPPATVAPPRPAAVTPQCPTCGSAMKLRTARQGSQAGSQFWGCSKYPACRGTRPLAPVHV